MGYIESDLEDWDKLLAGWKQLSSNDSAPLFDTLINCAGLTQRQTLLTTPSASIAQILEVNLKAPIELSRHLLKDYFAYGKQLRKHAASQSPERSFCVINVSSILADRGREGEAVYSASKAAISAFTRTLTLEAAKVSKRFLSLPPFRANVVVPGYIETPMTQSLSDEQKQELLEKIPLRRYGTPKEVAEAVLFLLNNEYANNTVLNLDGGLSAA